MGLTNVDLDRIDGNSGLLSNVNTSSINGGPLAGTRNRIINGDMRIDQRNAGASVTPTSADVYTLDRWVAFRGASSKYSVQQNAGAITPPSGFKNYIGFTSLSAYTVGSSEVFGLGHRIEGFNFADLMWGTASAIAVTLSFWVRSSLTGTFGGSFQNSASNRSYPFSYSISSANTWEYKTITVPGDTSGTWLADNGVGVQLTYSIGTGSTYSGTAGAWSGSNLFSATGATSVVGTNGATFYLTGVQLEAGSVATPFERRSYGQELALCRRYYYRVKHDGITNNRLTTAALVYSSTGMIAITPFLAEMRTAPTSVEQSGTAGHYAVFNASGSQITCSAVPAFNVAGKWYAETAFTVSSGLTAGNVTYGYALNSAAYLGWSAEL